MPQYTRYTRLWFQPQPSDRSRSKHFQNPQRGRLSTTSLSAWITGASIAAWSFVGLYSADRGRPTALQARTRDS